jgi:oxygen-dependent protoporphyrinogen oxidase
METLPKTIARRIGEDLLTKISDFRLQISEFEAQNFESSNADRFSLEFERAGTRQRVTCKHVVIAAPARAAAAIVRDSSDELSRLLEEIYYPPLIIVSLSYNQSSIERPLDGFGFLVPPSERINILGCVWNSSLFKGRAPEGHALVTVFIGGARNTKAAELADAELVTLVHTDLQKILGISSEPRVVAITRWERAIPQYNIGHVERVRRVEELLRERPGLHLAGNYLHGVSTGDCIKEADRMAKEIGESLSGA